VAISIPGRVVVFDYGEVISRTPAPDAQAELAALAGVDLPTLQAAWARHREELDHGTLGIVDYWRTMARELGTEWSLTRIHELWARDFASWFTLEPEVGDLIGELHAGGTRLALLSNAGFDYGDPFRFSPLGSIMERVFVSAELGLLKPDPEIYRRVMTELGVEPAGMAFIDNKAVNVEAAAALGIATHHFTSPAGLRAFLEGLAA
jgi:putative hydrolase of the HAD superfamily